MDYLIVLFLFASKLHVHHWSLTDEKLSLPLAALYQITARFQSPEIDIFIGGMTYKVIYWAKLENWGKGETSKFLIYVEALK